MKLLHQKFMHFNTLLILVNTVADTNKNIGFDPKRKAFLIFLGKYCWVYSLVYKRWERWTLAFEDGDIATSNDATTTSVFNVDSKIYFVSNDTSKKLYTLASHVSSFTDGYFLSNPIFFGSPSEDKSVLKIQPEPPVWEIGSYPNNNVLSIHYFYETSAEEYVDATETSSKQRTRGIAIEANINKGEDPLQGIRVLYRTLRASPSGLNKDVTG